VCAIKEKGGKYERMEKIEAKNLPKGRTLTTFERKRVIKTKKERRRDRNIEIKRDTSHVCIYIIYTIKLNT